MRDKYVKVHLTTQANKYFTPDKCYVIQEYSSVGNILIIDDQGDTHYMSSRWYTVVDDYNSIGNKEFQYESIPNLI